MVIEFENYLTFENIYLYTNLGVLPFWILLIAAPNSKTTQFFLNSIILPFLLASVYVYIIYQAILLDESFGDIFNLYLSLDNLYTLFSTDSFLLAFWIHFLSISLFVGGYIARDAQKYMVPKVLSFISLLLTYLAGPVGLVLYWFIRIFFSRKISFND